MNNDLYRQIMETISHLSDKYHLKAGVSFEYENDIFTYFAFYQAIYALNYPENKEKVFCFERCFTDCVVSSCLEKKIKNFIDIPS